MGFFFLAILITSHLSGLFPYFDSHSSSLVDSINNCKPGLGNVVDVWYSNSLLKVNACLEIISLSHEVRADQG